VVVALGFIGDPSSVNTVSALLKDKDASVRYSAAASLATLHSPAAVPALSDALKDTDVQLRRVSARALGEIGDPSAVPVLQPLLKDADMNVQVAAVYSLGKLKDASSIPALKKNLKKGTPAELRVMSAQALASQGDTAGRAAALEILEDRTVETRLRLQAVQTLGLLSDKSSVPSLKKLLTDETDENVKRAATALVDRFAAQP
jgi:HEAT repeat protein